MSAIVNGKLIANGGTRKESGALTEGASPNQAKRPHFEGVRRDPLVKRVNLGATGHGLAADAMARTDPEPENGGG